MDSSTVPASGAMQPSLVHAESMRLDLQDMTSGTRPTTSDANAPSASAPPTPGMKTPLSRRTSQAPPSPLANANSPRTNQLRRASSSASLNRPPSSPKLMKKSSRTSLSGVQDEEKERRPTPKRSISNLITGLREAQATMESIEEPIPLTAPQIAIEHFTRELLGHSQPDSEAETVVIIHDACYGHRYSRLKASKTTLSMIVERPERIHASVLGASTAYVRLGEHHAGGKQAPHPERTQITNPPFKIRRSARSMDITSPYVTSVHGTGWMSELREMCHAAAEKLAAGAKELSRPPTNGEPEKRKLHEGDLYLAPESLNAFQGALGGVADAVDTVFSPTSNTHRAFVAVRPPGHHCSADHPSGFCWLNNVHVGIEYAAQIYGLTHAAILDFDLHHGDGSQAITWERNSKNNVKRLNAKPTSKLKLGPDIGYYSIHDINSYPCEMGDDEKVQAASLCVQNAHGQSIWNVHLQPWKNEEDFWKLYEERYQILLDKARQFLEHHTSRHRAEGKIKPKAAVFISAGFDASEWEGQGMQRHKVNVPTEFYARFTRETVQLAQEAGTGCDGRVISVLEGGYSDRALCSGVLSHLSGLCTSPVAPSTNGAGSILGLSNHLDSLSINGLGTNSTASWDNSWWSAANLTALEMKVNPPPPPAPGKKVRAGPQPTYATPTESFAYKVIDPHKFARSISGTMREGPMPIRPPTPPAPEVDWIVATQELSKLLIPTDRQTKSCTSEELAVVRTKKDRQSAGPVLSTVEQAPPRQLRDRKGKGPTSTESVHSDEPENVRSVSRSSRRETISVLPSSDEPAPPSRRLSRRLSAGSTLSTPSSEVDADAPPVPTLPSTAIGASASTATQASSAPTAAVQVKKTRPTSKLRKPGAPITEPPSTTVPAKPLSSLPDQVNGADRAVNHNGQDVDSLTTGMKKITLKVGTKEDHDRKQKEKLDAERRARALKGAETRRVNAAAKKAAKEGAAVPSAPRPGATAPLPTPPSSGTVPPAAIPSAGEMKYGAPPSNINPMGTTMLYGNTQAPPPPIADHQMPDAAPFDPSMAAAPYSYQPAAMHMPLNTAAEGLTFPSYENNPGPPPTLGQAPDAAAFGQYNMPMQVRPQSASQMMPSMVGYGGLQGPPTSSGHAQHAVNGTAPTSSSSPLRPSSRGDKLPTWSSTGPIPFGAPYPQAMPANLVKSPQNGQDVKEVDIWAVPETPAK